MDGPHLVVDDIRGMNSTNFIAFTLTVYLIQCRLN